MPDPDVLFVVLDSLRRDRVSAYGHDRETTPAFDRLAAHSSVFEHAYTPAPWTLPSHCSMFTGRFPTEHGVTNGFTDRSLRLPEAIPTVTERLVDEGYRAAGFSNNPWVGRLSGLDRGFETFVEWDLDISRGAELPIHRRRDRAYARAHNALGWAARQPFALVKRRFFTRHLVERAKRWFELADAPTFTFMNLMEAHSPYYPPAGAFEALGLSPPGAVEARTLNTKLIPYTAGKTSLDPDTRRRVLEFYDASVRFQDDQLGALLEHLSALDRLEEMLVVVCADHGKTLGEFDRSARPTHYLRNVNTKVPLLVKRPNQQTAERVDQPVGLVGLFDLMLGQDPFGRPGRSEAVLIEDSLPHTGRSAKSVTRWRALADGHTKYVRAETGDEHLLEGAGVDDVVVGDGDLEAYRSALDERVKALGDPMDRSAEPGEDVGRSVEAQLEDLGYL